jgi:hypothetical protein
MVSEGKSKAVHIQVPRRHHIQPEIIVFREGVGDA